MNHHNTGDNQLVIQQYFFSRMLIVTVTKRYESPVQSDC